MYEDEDDFDHGPYRSARKEGKLMGSGAPHLPNKAERKALARIAQKSGMTEEQIRKDKAHRIALSAAQKSMQQGKGELHRQIVIVKRFRRRIAGYMNLPTWDPAVVDAVKKHFENQRWPSQRLPDAIYLVLKKS